MAAELEYAPASKWRYARRYLAVVGIAIACVIALLVAPAQWWAMKARWNYAKCARFSLPPNTIVYDEDAADIGKLKQNSQYVASTIWSARPHVLLPIKELNTYAGATAAPPVFLHELTSPAGHRRVVAIQFTATANYPFDRIFFYAYEESRSQIPPGGSRMGLEMFRAKDENVTLYAGQMDPNDASHFTIDYAMSNRRETIDGWLFDDDTVRLIPRCGDVAYMPDRGIWIPGNGQPPEWVFNVGLTQLGRNNAAPTSRPMSTIPDPLTLANARLRAKYGAPTTKQ